jgi:hypothetical protein
MGDSVGVIEAVKDLHTGAQPSQLPTDAARLAELVARAKTDREIYNQSENAYIKELRDHTATAFMRLCDGYETILAEYKELRDECARRVMGVTLCKAHDYKPFNTAYKRIKHGGAGELMMSVYHQIVHGTISGLRTIRGVLKFRGEKGLSQVVSPSGYQKVYYSSSRGQLEVDGKAIAQIVGTIFGAPSSVKDAVLGLLGVPNDQKWGQLRVAYKVEEAKLVEFLCMTYDAGPETRKVPHMVTAVRSVLTNMLEGQIPFFAANKQSYTVLTILEDIAMTEQAMMDPRFYNQSATSRINPKLSLCLDLEKIFQMEEEV